MHTTIYYFTGTGNSLKIARDIAHRMPDCELRHMAAALRDAGGSRIAADKLGIVFPVYVEGLPRIVERCVRSLEISPQTYIFAVANYGGSAGGSLVQLEQMLNEKECRIAAAFGLKMPDNTQILFPPGSEGEQRRDLERAAKAIDALAQTVCRGADSGAALLQAARRQPGCVWQRPEFDPAKMAAKFFADAQCDGCGICEKVCPVANVTMVDGRPRWLDRCELCLACMQWCPQRAIQSGARSAGWGRYHHPEIRVEELFRASLS